MNFEARYANRQSGEAQTFVTVGSTPTRAIETTNASVGHWQASVAVTHPPSGTAGSTPARRTGLHSLARCDDGFAASLSSPPTRTSIPVRVTLARCDVGAYSQALNLADAGSIPVRVTDTTKWWNLVDTRHSECRALEAWEFNSPLRHFLQVRQVPSWVS